VEGWSSGRGSSWSQGSDAQITRTTLILFGYWSWSSSPRAAEGIMGLARLLRQDAAPHTLGAPMPAGTRP